MVAQSFCVARCDNLALAHRRLSALLDEEVVELVLALPQKGVEGGGSLGANGARACLLVRAGLSSETRFVGLSDEP